MLTKLLVGAAVISKKRRKKENKNNSNAWNRNFGVKHVQMNLHMFHSSISAFGSTVDEPGAQGSHVFKLKT